MTIYGYSGKPGAGKTYNAVANVIIPALQQGRTVYHNLILRETPLRIIAGSQGKLVSFSADCTPDELVNNAPAGALVVIDESLRYWPSGIRANKVPPNQSEFFSKHRHSVGEDGKAMDIVLICQDFGSQCAAFIRELIEINYYAKKLAKFGAPNSYKLSIYDGVVKGDSPSENKLIRSDVKKYDPAIFTCYISHTKSQKGIAGEELRDKEVSIFKNWTARSAIIGLALIIPMSCTALNSFASLGGKSHTQKPQQPEAVRPAAPVQTAPTVPVPLPESTEWRLAGRIVIDNLMYYVASNGHAQRFIKTQNCRFDDSQNQICELNGTLVAEWTGRVEAQQFQAIVPQMSLNAAP